VLPEMGDNGPGMHLTLLGEVDEVIGRPGGLISDLHVVEREKLIEDAIRRIRQAARKYNLQPNVTQMLVGQFLVGATDQR